jgi:hypothetical protein
MGQNNQGGGGGGGNGGYRTELDHINAQYDAHMAGTNAGLGVGLGVLVGLVNPIAGVMVALASVTPPPDHHQEPRR